MMIYWFSAMTLQSPPSNLQSDDPESSTGLPLLHTWPSVYAFILTAFALIVLALYLFTRTLS